MHKLIAFFILSILFGVSAGYAGSLSDNQLSDPVVEAPADDFWAGGYMGAVLGFGTGNSRQCDLDCGVSSGDNLPINPEGGVVGVIAGYNWQFDRTVVGIEGSFMQADMNGGEFEVPTFLCGGFLQECLASINQAATLQGRLGYAYDRTLPFVTLGVAWTEYFGGFTDSFFPAGDVSATQYVIGVGVDYAVNDALRLRLEGLHFTDPGTLDFSGPGAWCHSCQLGLG